MTKRSAARTGLGLVLSLALGACGGQRPAQAPSTTDLSALSPEARAALAASGEPLVPARYVMEAHAAGVPIVFLDARPPLDYSYGHIPGALSAPYFEAEAQAQSLALPKDELYVTYCECPHAEAVQLADALRAAGYTNVKTIDEGLQGWRDLGGELVGGTAEATGAAAADATGPPQAETGPPPAETGPPPAATEAGPGGGAGSTGG